MSDVYITVDEFISGTTITFHGIDVMSGACRTTIEEYLAEKSESLYKRLREAVLQRPPDTVDHAR